MNSLRHSAIHFARSDDDSRHDDLADALEQYLALAERLKQSVARHIERGGQVSSMSSR